MLPATFYFFTIVFSALISIFIAIGFWGTANDDEFGGWQILKANGFFFQCACVCFFLSSVHQDVAFIRVLVLGGNLCITAWVVLGVPKWPGVWQGFLAGWQWDQLLWTTLSLFCVGLPMFRQFMFDDSKVKFDVGKENTELAEAIWREWWRRAGIPRYDFKTIIELAEFIPAPVGYSLPMTAEDSDTSSDSEDEQINGSGGAKQIFYYIASGSVEAQLRSARSGHSFTMQDGYWLDAFALLAMMGHASVAFAMQPSSPTAVVNQEGTILLKWTERNMSRILCAFDGFAPSCLKSIVSGSTLDSLYAQANSGVDGQLFQIIEKKRQELARAPLTKKAAGNYSSCWVQFKHSFISIRDLWTPSNHQRVVNAMRAGSQDEAFLMKLQETKSLMNSLIEVVRVRSMGASMAPMRTE